MTDSPTDISFSISSCGESTDLSIQTNHFESSLDSYSIIFDRAQHNYTASSEILSLRDPVDEPDPPVLIPVDNNRTFTKEITTTVINAFTGKPISPNPWRKLCTKQIPSAAGTAVAMPIEVSQSSHLAMKQSDEDKTFEPVQLKNKRETRLSRRDMISNRRAMDTSNDDQVFEQFLQEHRRTTINPCEEHTSLTKGRKARLRSKDPVRDPSPSSTSSSSSSPSNVRPNVHRPIVSMPLWQKLADVYTSEESDERMHLLSSNLAYTVRLKSDIYTSDPSTESSSVSSSVEKEHRSSTCTKSTRTTFDFLESLSESIPIEAKHPDARKYFLHCAFQDKDKRQELADRLFSMFNVNIFSSKLSDKVNVAWSARLTATAGHCTTRRTTRTAVITLSHKVCDSPERCRDTLLHELCHAAVTLIDGVLEYGHGPAWRQWTRIAEHCYPYLPPISVRHTYDVTYKFIYRCIQCQHEVHRHSKSVDLEIDSCGKCLARFELFVNNARKNDNVERQAPKKPPNRYNLFVKEHFQRMKQSQPHLSTPQLMGQLSKEYKKQQGERTKFDLSNFDQLKI